MHRKKRAHMQRKITQEHPRRNALAERKARRTAAYNANVNKVITLADLQSKLVSPVRRIA